MVKVVLMFAAMVGAAISLALPAPPAAVSPLTITPGAAAR